MIKKFIIASSLLFVCSSSCYANAFPNALGGTFTNAAIRGGLSSTSAELSATLSGLASSVGEAISGAGSLRGALALGRGAITGLALSEAIVPTIVIAAASVAGDAALKMYFNNDGTVSVQSVSMAPSAATHGFSAGDTVWIDNDGNQSDSIEVLKNFAIAKLQAQFNGKYTASFTSCGVYGSGNNTHTSCDENLTDSSGTTTDIGSVGIAFYHVASVTCASGSYYSSSEGSCDSSGLPSGPPVTTTTTYPDAATAGGALTDDQKGMPVDPSFLPPLAQGLANTIAQDPAYRGIAPPTFVPSDVPPLSTPITVGDLVAPLTPSDITNITNNTTINNTAAPSTPASAASPASTVKVDLGQDPGIPAPTLEDTPDGSTILAPIFGLLPDFKNFQMPAHTSQCPTYVFNVYGKEIDMDAQCTLFEQIKPTLSSIFTAVWALVAAIIVLTA
jgi:hypothetical protein